MRNHYYQTIGETSLAFLDITDMGEAWIINRVNVPKKHRGKGIGRALMQKCLADADAEGVTLQLDINPYGEMSYTELRAWYERLGFIQKYKNGPFIRKPKPTDTHDEGSPLWPTFQGETPSHLAPPGRLCHNLWVLSNQLKEPYHGWTF